MQKLLSKIGSCSKWLSKMWIKYRQTIVLWHGFWWNKQLERFDNLNVWNQVDLTYFPQDEGYQYSMNTCLLNAAIDQVLPQCNCTPHSLPKKIAGLPFCTGKGVTCFQVILMLEFPGNRVVNWWLSLKINWWPSGYSNYLRALLRKTQ